jgi:Rod binding domain-containing protein
MRKYTDIFLRCAASLSGFVQFLWKRFDIMDSVSSAGRRVARQLEASFASEMLQAARPQKRQGLFDGGAGAGAFDSFMDHALGDAMAARGGLGLAPAIERVIGGRATPQGTMR